MLGRDKKGAVCMDIAICVAVICAGLLPLFWSKSRDEKNAYKELFLFGTCLLNAVVVYILAMVSTC